MLTVDNMTTTTVQQTPALSYGGPNSGYSGTATSRERALRDDRSGATGQRQRAILDTLAMEGYRGITVKEMRQRPQFHHGNASGALSNLHRKGLIVRLTETRGGCVVYCLPEFAGQRSVESYVGNSEKHYERGFAAGWDAAIVAILGKA